MFGWRLWKFCLPLSLFVIIGCSESNVGVRTSPNTSDRGIRGPNLLQFPNLEAAKKYRAEQRKIDGSMSAILSKLHGTPISDERTKLKSEWIALDKEILGAKSTEELVAKREKVQALDAKVPAPTAPPQGDDMESKREELIIALSLMSDAMSEVETLVADLKPIASKMASGELSDWGSAAHFIDAFAIRYVYLRHGLRLANSYEELADIARQLRQDEVDRARDHVNALKAIKARVSPPAEPEMTDEEKKTERSLVR